MISKTKQLLAAAKSLYRHKPGVFWFRAVVLLAVSSLIIFQRNFWTPDTLFIVLLAVFAVFGQARLFLLRFAPFILLLLAYDSFRGIADDLNHNVHYFEMIGADRSLFGGTLPTITLQQWWWNGHVQWYDFYFYLLYTFHFLAPLLLAVLIWKVKRSLYWPFVVGLVGLSFMAFITYVLFPAAPPWMASDMGLIEPIHRISSDIWYAMGVTNFSALYANISPNAVAAVPSLHAAYPVLFVLFAGKLFGLKRTWWLWFYPLSVWLGVVYLGEHYAIDVILGLLYALFAYGMTMSLFAWLEQYRPTLTWQYERGFAWGIARARRR